ncbi:MAG: hypothetical protein E6H44_02200 [Betaproteobacteria bacterium]|nr:MAG: hypothetical protein E6H44_02200 [Betaproteobacteria bacterium]
MPRGPLPRRRQDRLKEAAKLDFEKAIVPRANQPLPQPSGSISGGASARTERCRLPAPWRCTRRGSGAGSPTATA